MAAVDYFLKMDGIPGDSMDREHKDEIEILSFSLGESIVGDPAGGGGAGGKVIMQDIHFTANFNKASPVLFKSCATGKHVPSAVLTGRMADQGSMNFYKVKFDDVLVTSYNTSGADDAVPTDQFSLNF